MKGPAPIPVKLGVWYVRPDGRARLPLRWTWKEYDDGNTVPKIAGKIRWHSGVIRGDTWATWEWRVWAKAGGGAHEATAEECARLGLPSGEDV